MSDIRTIRDSEKYQVIVGDVTETGNFIVCNTKVENFRATQCAVAIRETANQVVISQAVADAIQVTEGDWVRIAAN